MDSQQFLLPIMKPLHKEAKQIILTLYIISKRVNEDRGVPEMVAANKDVETAACIIYYTT